MGAPGFRQITKGTERMDKIRIALADDDDAMRGIMRRVVEKAGEVKRGLAFDREERTQSCRYFISTFKWAE